MRGTPPSPSFPVLLPVCRPAAPPLPTPTRTRLPHPQMGPSGSGKTTLLDLMAGRRIGGAGTGAIRFGGVEPTQGFLRRYAGYVEQFDCLIASLSVYEM